MQGQNQFGLELLRSHHGNGQIIPESEPRSGLYLAHQHKVVDSVVELSAAGLYDLHEMCKVVTLKKGFQTAQRIGPRAQSEPFVIIVNGS